MNKKILCPGELLIDFICTDVNQTLESGENFIKKAGGAPANVAAAISKLGGCASFAGCVGDDAFGYFLRATLEKEEVDCRHLIHSQEHKTTLAFVSLGEEGQRDFSFVRGADQFLTLTAPLIAEAKDAKIIHFGSATGFMGAPLESSYLKLMKDAWNQGVFVSFDPNYRTALFGNNKEEFVKKNLECLSLVDLVKVSDDELALLTGHDDLEGGIKFLRAQGAKHIVVSLGKEGLMYVAGHEWLKVTSPQIKAVDTTGAGDALIGGLLYQLAECPNPKAVLEDLDQMQDLLTFAAAVGASACLKHGAIKSLPTKEAVLALLA